MRDGGFEEGAFPVFISGCFPRALLDNGVEGLSASSARNSRSLMGFVDGDQRKAIDAPNRPSLSHR